jgi:phosphoglycerate dehydrogenase-like enzyme
MLCVLFLAKAFPVMQSNRRNHLWKDYPLKEVCGQTIGIVGFGETGPAVSRFATAFGMRVLATKRDRDTAATTEHRVFSFIEPEGTPLSRFIECFR